MNQTTEPAAESRNERIEATSVPDKEAESRKPPTTGLSEEKRRELNESFKNLGKDLVDRLNSHVRERHCHDKD